MIFFDLYIIYSIKDTKCNRRNAVEGISTNTFGSEQQLSINTKIFWAVGENTIKLQQFFIDWHTKNYSGSISLYLGGSHHGEIISWFKLLDGILTQDHFLKWNPEEVDDRILFYVNHTVKVDKYSKVVIASSDTDVFVNALYHFSWRMHSGLDELWIINRNVTASMLYWFTQLSATWIIALFMHYL